MLLQNSFKLIQQKPQNSLVVAKGFYLTEDMTKLYLFIQGSLEWSISELFSSDVLLWNQFKYIVFKISFCRILIISYTLL